MSASAGGDGAERQALQAVEGAVGRLLAELASLRERVADLDRADGDPAGLARRARELEAENAALRARIDEGRQSIERIQARLRFIEEQSP
jgi:predicted  nucleic acid-binding Zn-ribbon protein